MKENRMSRIGHHIYVDGGLEAIQLYKTALNLESEGTPWVDEQGVLIHAELQLNGKHFLSISDIKHQDGVMKKLNYKIVNPRMMFTLYFSDEGDLRKAYQLLTTDVNPKTDLRNEEHSVISCDIIDKYGICWHLCVPKDWDAVFIPR